MDRFSFGYDLMMMMTTMAIELQRTYRLGFCLRLLLFNGGAEPPGRAIEIRSNRGTTIEENVRGRLCGSRWPHAAAVDIAGLHGIFCSSWPA
jgi:hypothetical protein